MSRFIIFFTLLMALLGTANAIVLGQGSRGQLPRDEIELSNRVRHSGLIESEDADWLTLIRIETPPGRAMHLVIQPFDRGQVASITRLDADQRAALQGEIAEFRNRATIEAVRMNAVRLGPSQGEGRAYHHYLRKWLSLDCTADEQDTRRVIVRAEQIFAAYRQILPPRTVPARPLRLIVLGSMDEYQTVLRKLGVKAGFQNPACFIEEQNTVVVGSELGRLKAVNAQMVAENAQLRRDLRDLERRLAERLRTVGDSLRKSGMSNGEVARALLQERSKFQKQRDKKNEELRQSDVQIDRLFKQSAGQMLARLYHEAFHAYVRNWVFPRPQYDLPPWLDEGLAVLYETGLLEGNSLRIDAPNPRALKKLKANMTGANPMALDDLLAATKGHFLIAAAARPAAADRYYVNAWGLAYYLTFEKRLLDSPALEKYLQSANSRLTPAERFRRLVDMPANQFDEQWRAYIGSM